MAEDHRSRDPKRRVAVQRANGAGNREKSRIAMGTPLSRLRTGARGRIVRITRDLTARAERLAALGITPGASIRVLQTFPGIVFECDQTELAVERAVAGTIWVIEGD